MLNLEFERIRKTVRLNLIYPILPTEFIGFSNIASKAHAYELLLTFMNQNFIFCLIIST